MLTPAAASTLLTSILILASPISAQALNGPQITKPTASAIQLRRSHGTNHTSIAHILQKDRERIRYKYGKQSRRAGLVAPKTGGAPPSKRDVTRTPRPFDIKAKRQGQTGTEPMIVQHDLGVDLSYYGTVSVGTLPQETTVLFDTGSSDLVVPLTNCLSEHCIGPLFDPSQSTTYNSHDTLFYIDYEDGNSATGIVASDTVTLAGLTVTQQTFGAVFGIKGFSGPYAGILGLGFPANAVSRSNPFFGSLVDLRSLQSNVFSFYMAKDGAEGSELCLGCVNRDRYEGEINYHPIVTYTDDGKPLAWDIECTGIFYTPPWKDSNAESSSRWESGKFQASIDSGTDFIYVSKQVAQKLYDLVLESHLASQHWDEGSYAFPCDSVDDMGELIFEFGENKYGIKWQDLIAGREKDNSDECVGAIFGDDSYDDGQAVFGVSFMKNLYSVFDYERRAIGFAELR